MVDLNLHEFVTIVYMLRNTPGAGPTSFSGINIVEAALQRLKVRPRDSGREPSAVLLLERNRADA